MNSIQHMTVAAGVAVCLSAGALAPAPARAEGMIAVHRMPALLAGEAVSAAVAACAKQGYAVSATVVDLDGVTQAVLRGDHAGVSTLDSAYDKAYTAASLLPIRKLPTTRALVESFKGEPPPLPLQTAPHLLPAAGGVLVMVGSEPVGAIGVAGAPGGQLDEGCGKAGIDRIRAELK